MRSSSRRSGTDRQTIEIQDNEEMKVDDQGNVEQRIHSQVSARSLEEAAVEEQRQERQRLKDKEESKKQLAKMLMKESSGSYFAQKSMSDGKEKLNFLLKQTEMFTQFILQSRNMKGGVQKQRDLQQVQKNLIMSMKSIGKGGGTSRRKNKKSTQNIGEGGEAAEQDDGNFTITRLEGQPAILKNGTLRDYQLDSLNWMVGLYETGINGILADEMGLGKTVQAISLLAFLREFKHVKNYFLIIVPKAVIPHWKKEFKRWCPEIRVLNLIATKAEREEILRNDLQPGRFDVCLTTFEGVRLCMSQILKFKWEYIIVDEAHKIKNEESQISKRLRQLDSRYRLLLTGTPLQNNLHELWSLLNFLLPEIFSSSDAFDEMFDLNQDIDESEAEKEQRNKQVIEQLHRILRPFLLRRIKKEVEKSLPPKVEIHVSTGITEQQKSIYRDLLKKSMIEKGNSVTYYKNILIQLRKVCNHPYLFENQEPDGAEELGEHLINSAGKMIFVDKLLKKSIADGNQTLIFSGFTTMLDILEDYCCYRGHKYCRLDGNSSLEDRERSIDEFTKEGSEKNVFLVSTRAGGLGLNLMSANIVVLYDSDWNPQVDLQAMDRAHRIGQTKVVQVFRLITSNTMEQKMIERQTMKLKLDSLIIQKGRLAPKTQGLQKEEMQDMVNYGADGIFKVGNELCDQDIDTLISEGKDRAKTMQEEAAKKLKDKLNMADFEMNSMNLYQFEDVDYKKRREDQLKMDEHLRTMIIDDTNVRRRTVQKNLNESNLCPKIFQGRNVGISEDTKRKKLQIVQDFRFFPNPERLKELIEKEIDSKYAGYFQGIEYVDFTEEEKIEKQYLLDQGFVNWDRRDFQKTCQALELYPREEIELIAKHIGTKTPDEVKRYLEVFYTKIETLNETTKIKRNLNKAEAQHDFKKQAPNLIKQKVVGYDRPVEEMKLDVVQKSKYFSKEADIVLLCLTHEHGYGNWAAIKNAVRRDTRTRFDHLFMSRSEQELSKRVDILVKSLEKEIQDAKKRELKGIKQQEPNGLACKVQTMEDEGSDIEMFEIDEAADQPDRQDGDIDDKDIDDQHDDEELRIGKDNHSNDSADEKIVKPKNRMLMGEKRKRNELIEEEEDMDFEAIEDEMKKQKIV